MGWGGWVFLAIGELSEEHDRSPLVRHFLRETPRRKPKNKIFFVFVFVFGWGNWRRTATAAAKYELCLVEYGSL